MVISRSRGRLMAKELRLYDRYSREDVHDIFDAESVFTPQSGRWGITGIVRINDTGNRVFFVTFGQSQSGHDFDESISDDGVLTWQSQPKQKLSDPVIQELINHDHAVRDIHLFLRTKEQAPYFYMGRLAYVDHAADREQPVHFLWQLLSWPAPASVLGDIGISLVQSGSDDEDVPALGLKKVDPPQKRRRRGTPTNSFARSRQIVIERNDEENSALGLHGEHLILDEEKRLLVQAGRQDLADQVVHVAVVEGDGAGYDIRSFFPGGAVKHIEVKTTRGGRGTDFYISPNELAFARGHEESYRLYRVFSARDDINHAPYFELTVEELFALFDLIPSQYRVRLMGEEETGLPSTTNVLSEAE